jgi:hypothetical protein
VIEPWTPQTCAEGEQAQQSASVRLVGEPSTPTTNRQRRIQLGVAAQRPQGHFAYAPSPRTEAALALACEAAVVGKAPPMAVHTWSDLLLEPT